MSQARLLNGDARQLLQTLEPGSIRCCVTSPPYWGLRDYGHPDQIGQERTPQEYAEALVSLFRLVREALAEDGTLWLNMGDCYIAAPQGPSLNGSGLEGGLGNHEASRASSKRPSFRRDREAVGGVQHKRAPGLKEKDLVGLPWMLATALRADGWYLRSEIIWHKPNPMPESVRDRPTKAHESIFLLSKSQCYFYDADAIAEGVSPQTHPRMSQDVEGQQGSARANGGGDPRPMKAGGRGPGVNPKAAANHAGSRQNESFSAAISSSGNKARKLGDERGRPGSHMGGSIPWEGSTRNTRSVWRAGYALADAAAVLALMNANVGEGDLWTIGSQAYAGAHFATFPEELARRCILAGSEPGDTVLDPFGGSGTTGQVATGNARDAVLIELNPEYVHLQRQRIGPLLCSAAL